MSTTKVSTSAIVRSVGNEWPEGPIVAVETVVESCAGIRRVPLGEEWHARLLGARIGKSVTITIEWEDEA
jgi:hypothetical protein